MERLPGDTIDLTSQPGTPQSPRTQQSTTAADAATTTCTICLGPIQHLSTDDPPFHWPACRHITHWSCTANLRAHQPQPACPSCRNPWPPHIDTILQGLCSDHGIVVPDPPPARQTASAGHHIPAAPQDILPLCCHRVMLTDPARAHETTAPSTRPRSPAASPPASKVPPPWPTDTGRRPALCRAGVAMHTRTAGRFLPRLRSRTAPTTTDTPERSRSTLHTDTSTAPSTRPAAIHILATGPTSTRANKQLVLCPPPPRGCLAAPPGCGTPMGITRFCRDRVATPCATTAGGSPDPVAAAPPHTGNSATHRSSNRHTPPASRGTVDHTPGKSRLLVALRSIDPLHMGIWLVSSTIRIHPSNGSRNFSPNLPRWTACRHGSLSSQPLAPTCRSTTHRRRTTTTTGTA